MSATPPTPPPASRRTRPGDGPTPGDGPASEVPSGTVRRTGDRVVAGVAAGLGRRYGLDPVLVRILFAVTAFAGGLGALVYVVLWLALPLVEASAPPRSAPGGDRGPAFWVGAIAITIGAVIAVSALPAPRILFPLALITVGVALWQRPGGSGTAPGRMDVAGDGRAQVPEATQVEVPPSWQPPPVPGRPASPIASAASDGSTSGAWVGAAATGAGTATRDRPRRPVDESSTPERVPDVRWWVPPDPRPRPSWLGPVTVAVALVATGVVALLGEAGILFPTAVDLLAVALAVLAGGLLVGTVRGRAKWLAVPSLALAGVLVLAQGANGLGIALTPTVGVRQVTPETLSEAGDVGHGVGELLVWLVDTDLSTGTGPVDVELIAGEVLVVVPEDAVVNVHAELGGGEVVLVEVVGADEESGTPEAIGTTIGAGGDVLVEQTLRPAGPAGDTIDLVVAVGVGQVKVFRGSEAHELGVWDDGVDIDGDGDVTFEFDLGEGGSATIETEDVVPDEDGVEFSEPTDGGS